MVIPAVMLSRVPEVWSSFRVTKSSLNGLDMCEEQVSKYSLTCVAVAIEVEFATMDLHVSESGVISETHSMHGGVFCNPNKFTKASLLVHEGSHSRSPFVPLINIQIPVFHVVT